MAIIRRPNRNIRDVPGNGSIVGLSTSSSLGITTSNCQASYNTCGACVSLNLGTPYIDACGCPCCDVVCCCTCTLCDRTVPSGMWKTSEQYEARERDAWGDDTFCTVGDTCLCNINPGYACLSGPNCTNTGGYVICKAASVAWVVSPAGTEITRSWHNRSDAVTVAQTCASCGDWFVPSHTQLQDPGYTCRTYWDSYSATRYWANTEYTATYGRCVNLSTGVANYDSKFALMCVRAFRCVTY